ncbi:hypothetical protein F0562_001875 [Nyssa sinensis]|uniref:DUF7803 domain-containing protein n=1 Tax=Nyssa sinensis TaxID=561372 RepID=A0A5J5C9B5_9ASTE|nr:hypothetical protein F0562_001875 [Nyssa sinensis]
MDVDSQPMMEETILVGDDLMMGPPSPLIPPEIASHVLEGVDLCDGILRNMFLCLQINDIEPFCQDEIVLYRQCAEKRDKELRQRLQDSEHKLGLSMPLDEAKERAAQLESESTSLESAGRFGGGQRIMKKESRAASEASRHVKRDFSDQLRRGMLVTHSGNDTSFVGATCEGVRIFLC